METKEKLTEIIKSTVVNAHGTKLGDVFHPEFVENIVNNLIEGGVIVPPCKVGDEIKGEIVHEIEYREFFSQGDIQEETYVHTMDKRDVGSAIFCSLPISWEEAEAALKEKESNGRK